MSALKQVYDPEIPVNIVDLGLIYDCHLSSLNQGSFKADVKMTLTAPGCGMGPVLATRPLLEQLRGPPTGTGGY